MRNVDRTPRPGSLARNGSRWKKELLEALDAGESKLIRQRARRYNNPEVRAALDAMYRNLCCYCESQVGPVRADEIEHRMPIDGFPERAFDWDNLHLGCSGCNGAKSSKWDDDHPILDAVTDIPISNHVDYKATQTGVRCVWETQRGRTTMLHAALNREDLREARTFVMTEVVGVIQEIRERLAEDPTDPVAANLREELEERYEGPYGSMTRWAVSTLLDDVGNNPN